MKRSARNIVSMIAMIALAMGLGVGALSPAQAAPVTTNTATTAEEPPSCADVAVGEGTGECADVVAAESHSKSSASSRVVAVNGVSVTSDVTVLAYVQAKGATPKQMRAKKVRLPRAMRLLTSYDTTSGDEGWKMKWYPKGKLLVWGADGWFHDPNCYNKVKFRVKKRVPKRQIVTGKVKIVKRFSFTAAAAAKADEKVTSQAKAWCNTNSAYAYGEGRASASAYAVGRARLSGRVVVRVLARVRAAAQSDLQTRLGGRTVVQVRGDVRSSAFATATSEAKAKAVCQDVPPPPPENQAPQGDIVGPQHLFVGGTFRAKVYGSDPEDQGNVQLNYNVSGAAAIINNADYPTRCDVENTQKVCYFWIKAGNTPGEATITLTVTDSKGKTFTADPWKFPVVADEF